MILGVGVFLLVFADSASAVVLEVHHEGQLIAVDTLFIHDVAARIREGQHRAAELARNAERRSWVCTDDMENPEAIDAIYAERDHMSEFLGVAMHVDHIIPIARGGAHHEDNLQIITGTQNTSKGARTDWEPKPNTYEQVTYRTTRGKKK